MATQRSAARPPASEIEEHRIYFEVQRETAQCGDARITVALQVWLWATVPRKRGSLPGAPGCRAAVDALRRIAVEAIEASRIDPPPDVEPFHWALYVSSHVPDADEIHLVVDLHGAPGDGPESARRERDLAALRRALEAVGVSEGAWGLTRLRAEASPLAGSA